ncbi:hypothetical protein H0274_11170 [Altererythrobacter sp. CC-YST694]|uniref:hypothetical protein n=1 Tax=Altererythrobacter sp. CC-YST694 TaxID=2755038 RepID=UPI001D012344|nr:hypothetical protein [Altererythrobacter sp. CC-YST694]MCB5425822.1 hypothetical protein [Altererythrobacter sp. CC-YST694]
MTDLPPSLAPAAYIPFTALAWPSGEDSVAVGPDTPLPVTAAFGAAVSTPLAGTASSSMIVGPFTPDLGRPIWLTLSGSWSGRVQVKRSVDGGTTKLALTAAGINWGKFTTNACEPVAEESQQGATYYLDVVLASGSLDYEVAQ